MSSQHYEELARRVRERRRELDITQSQVASRGGPSDTKVSQVEKGEPQALSPSTLRKLDAALDWWPGSARWILEHGEHPVTKPQPRVDLAWPTPEDPRLSEATLDQLLAEAYRRTGHGLTPGQQQRAHADAAGEESQDRGDEEPS